MVNPSNLHYICPEDYTFNTTYIPGLTGDSTRPMTVRAPPGDTVVPVYYWSWFSGFNAHIGWSNSSTPQPQAVLRRPDWHPNPLFFWHRL